MFQWNYMNHGYIEQSCFDIDGVLCVDPTEEENDDGDKYRRFILNAKPLYIPHYNIYALVTSRLEKYRKETEEWLKKNNVQYKHLYMLDLSSKEERIRLNAHAKFKAEIYRRLDDTVLFYESNLSQAHEIAKITQKAVFCVETDELIKNYRNFSWHGSKERKTKKIIKKILRKIIKKILRMVIFKKSWRIKIREIIKRFVIRQSNKKNIEIRCRYKWLGTTYGGFDVCLDALDVKKKQEIIVYSAGVGCDISFDMELMKRYENIKILAFDPTPISLEWIKKQRIPPNYRFYPVGISDKEGKEKMYLPESHGVSFTVHDWDVSNKDTVEVKMETIGGIMQKNGHEFVDILKLDIEGSEFSVLRTIDFKSQFFGQILVEFHDRFIEDGEKELKRTINILRENGYYCFACSPFHEYSFINVRHIRNK
ncbi:MAG: FkbM family methyltransferase [Prevotellaceae bacterium]|nr:FkbM family methyltransferase [Prevotellaceae bacterium]